MSQPPRQIDPQLVYLDPFLLDRARVNLGLSRTDILKKTGLALNTLADAFQGGGLQPRKADKLSDCLGYRVLELLAPWDPRFEAPSQPPGAACAGATEWETRGYLGQGRLAPNGLYYIVCRMQHRYTAGRFGRGKFYHLSWIPVAQRREKQHQLSRHADVATRVGLHPNTAVNYVSTPAMHDEGWWVIDDWVGEETLADRLKREPWPAESLPRLMGEIAGGLAALHAASVVFRELAPARVLIAQMDGRAVLTDFELAKLLDGGPSVASEWPEDPFRAPEVEGGSATVKADLFSLAQLTAAALAGPSYDSAQAARVLDSPGLPKRLRRLLLDCLEPLPDQRPDALPPLLEELARWAKR